MYFYAQTPAKITCTRKPWFFETKPKIVRFESHSNTKHLKYVFLISSLPKLTVVILLQSHRFGGEIRYRFGWEIRHRFGGEIRHRFGGEIIHRFRGEIRYRFGGELRHRFGAEIRHRFGADIRHRFGGGNQTPSWWGN